jgi:hypothetical protein
VIMAVPLTEAPGVTRKLVQAMDWLLQMARASITVNKVLFILFVFFLMADARFHFSIKLAIEAIK